MDRETVIRVAREAGLRTGGNGNYGVSHITELERFAAAVEPTVEMLDSVQVKDHDDRWIQVELCADIYSAMLSAAPAPKEES